MSRDDDYAWASEAMYRARAAPSHLRAFALKDMLMLSIRQPFHYAWLRVDDWVTREAVRL